VASLKTEVEKVNPQEDSGLAMAFNVYSVPTFVLVNENGDVVDVLRGTSAATIEKLKRF